MVRIRRVQPCDCCHDLKRACAQRQNPPVRVEQRRHPVKSGDDVSGLLPQGRDEQVAKRVAAEFTLTREAVLHDARPGPSPAVVATQCSEGHPKISRRHNVEIPSQATTASAVIRHANNGGDVIGHAAEGPKRRCQTVSATERDNSGSSGLRARHSRPRSRCMTALSIPAFTSRAARFSAMATLRCLPPVQPMAIVTYRFPSTR